MPLLCHGNTVTQHTTQKRSGRSAIRCARQNRAAGAHITYADCRSLHHTIYASHNTDAAVISTSPLLLNTQDHSSKSSLRLRLNRPLTTPKTADTANMKKMKLKKPPPMP